ncbi:unnamed protein product [Kuraishia capsulata CBS 1993]|uniref:Major facilitator superfamily (MFS) profile domain-containing protein n=1 Tax=Kuraishia capsulata CBS 1993 TaxID=1382522 RepID=W6MW56_9ASCO|nr:uncharacterized protein KUCA_T00002885001 [Kuraishia capsulata CBS 1993]CDK26910.1 unnamed protein product [Kuraishia capsulata CBS 1993]
MDEKQLPGTTVVPVASAVDLDVKIKTIAEKTKKMTEEDLTIREALKKYPMALFWALFMALGIVMTGYDQALISTFYALPSFAKKYGQPDGDGGYEITAAWQTGLSMGSPIGQVLGPLLCSWPMEKWGRKNTMIFSCILVTGFNFIQFFAKNIGTICVGEMIAGVVWGVFVALSPTYAAEIAPLPLRPIVSSISNLAFVIGQFTAQGVQAGCQNMTTQWSYRIPFAVQWAWPAIILAGIFWCPESPWWLVRQNRISDAKISLTKLGWDTEEGSQTDELIELMKETNDLEQEVEAAASYAECFKKVSIRRTEICVGVFCAQVLVGNWYVSYLTYFFELAGLTTKNAFDLAVGVNAIGFTMTLLSWPLMRYVGRRPIFLFGCAGLGVVLIIMGGLDSAPNYLKDSGLRWGEAVMMVFWQAIYQITIGPLTFVILGEIPSTRLKSRVIALSLASSSLCGIAFGAGLPYMFADGWRGKTGFLFGGLSFILTVWTYFRLPETANKSFQEIDILFERGVSARHFASFDVTKLDEETASI